MPCSSTRSIRASAAAGTVTGRTLTSTRLAVALSSAWGKSTRAAASSPSCAFCSRLASRSRCPSVAWWGAAAACTWSWRCPWRNSPASDA
eukprot:scaffold78865_cov75-Phaeocystis_antarctica.AAC.3